MQGKCRTTYFYLYFYKEYFLYCLSYYLLCVIFCHPKHHNIYYIRLDAYVTINKWFI